MNDELAVLPCPYQLAEVHGWQPCALPRNHPGPCWAAPRRSEDRVTRYTAAADRLPEGGVDTYCDYDAPPVVQDVAVLLADVMVEHPHVDRIEVVVQVTPWAP